MIATGGYPRRGSWPHPSGTRINRRKWLAPASFTPGVLTALERFEEALAQAAARWGRHLERSADPVRRSADALLQRLGLDPRHASGALPAAALAGLERENARLRRTAARGDARYDLNRHIAVMRLLRGQEPTLPEPAFRTKGLPGAALNRRFGGKGPRA